MKQAGAGLTEAYEQMRRQQRGPGHEMVRRWGLVGWMERAAPLVPVSSPASPSTQTLLPPEGAPNDLYPKLTRLLADVAMSWLREERC